MDVESFITKHAKQLSLTSIAAAATVVSILGYSYSQSKKKAVGYKEIPLAKGWMPYFGKSVRDRIHGRNVYISFTHHVYVGHLWTYVFSGDIAGIKMAQRNSDMGPILHFQMGSKPWIVISDPDMAHELLNVHGISTSHRPKHSYGTRLQSQDHGLTFIDPGSRWKKTRAACEYLLLLCHDVAVLTIIIVTQYMSSKSLSNHLDDILDKEADCVVDRLLSNDEPVSVLKEIQWSALNVNLMLGFGYRIDHPEDPFFEQLIDLITVSVQHADPTFDRREFLPFIMGLVDWWHQKSKKLAWYMTQVRAPIMQKLIRHGLDGDTECLAKKLHAMKDGKDVDDETVISTCCKHD